MLIGRTNALEFAVAGGRPAVRRFAVYACKIEARAIVSAELSDDPVETLRLPLTHERAQLWLLEHFEDFAPARVRELSARLTRPTGAALGRTTGPLA